MSEEKGEEVKQIKLIAVGDSGVGKTSILTRFTYEKFSDYSEPTLGAAFLTKKHNLSNGKSIEFHVLLLLADMGYRRPRKVPLHRAHLLSRGTYRTLCLRHHLQTFLRSHEEVGGRAAKQWSQGHRAGGSR
jgi:hypothetical protein